MRSGIVALASLALAGGIALAGPSSPQVEVTRLARALAALHADAALYIREVRPAAAVAGAYMGLVRPGGADPRLPLDAPVPGRNRRYDLVVFDAPSEGTDVSAWTLLLLDHEYFHARHMARGDRMPYPSFPHDAAGRHFHEALAWGYNLSQAAAGQYGALAPERWSEAARRYRHHQDALRAFVQKRQPEAWAYYSRFLPDPTD